jgi:hypothetical protein
MSGSLCQSDASANRKFFKHLRLPRTEAVHVLCICFLGEIKKSIGETARYVELQKPVLIANSAVGVGLDKSDCQLQEHSGRQPQHFPWGDDHTGEIRKYQICLFDGTSFLMSYRHSSHANTSRTPALNHKQPEIKVLQLLKRPQNQQISDHQRLPQPSNESRSLPPQTQI